MRLKVSAVKWFWCLVIGCVLCLGSSSAWAQGLGEYKDQKHKSPDRQKVTKQSCPEAYVSRCMQECDDRRETCRATCEKEAPAFCEARQKRRRRKQAGVVAKGASVGAGAVAVFVDNRIPRKDQQGGQSGEGGGEPDPYAIYWNRLDAQANVGGGYLFAGAGIGTGTMRLRFSHFGLSGQVSHLNDGTDFLTESDVGPTFYIHSPIVLFGLQPSLLVSSGNDVDTFFGGGVRSYTEVHLTRRFLLNFDPMLGYINGQWNYHLRVGATYRLTPRFQANLSYDFRDIVDLNDLDISQSRLQGVLLQVGFRFNGINR